MKTIVEQYYKLIDEEDLEAVYKLFSENIKYNRAGRIMKGMQEFREFYESIRVLKGKHEIIEIKEVDNKVIVQGIFHKQEGGTIGFSDFFTIENNKITKRRSYIDEANV